jgi:hypothetical protein
MTLQNPSLLWLVIDYLCAYLFLTYVRCFFSCFLRNRSWRIIFRTNRSSFIAGLMNGQWIVVGNFVLEHPSVTFCFIFFWEWIMNTNVKDVVTTKKIRMRLLLLWFQAISLSREKRPLSSSWPSVGLSAYFYPILLPTCNIAASTGRISAKFGVGTLWKSVEKFQNWLKSYILREDHVGFIVAGDIKCP